MGNEQSGGVARSGDSGTFSGQPSLKHHHVLPQIVRQMFSFCLLASRLSASGEHIPCHLRWPKSHWDFSVPLHLLLPLSHLTHLFQSLAQTFLKPQVFIFKLTSPSQSSDLNFKCLRRQCLQAILPNISTFKESSSSFHDLSLPTRGGSILNHSQDNFVS